ncbi:alcohol dehydrogenase catalytic domain-containing protein [Microbacterium sp.]|uniref:zinc-binding dehydrogenase n=1 Tax=Microbacterium sp. TaxID=51671 RepID=UPI00263430CC|nr:alcohol dehydrogenase catalytic domain-containing protein [Microbacterium sp.]MCV0335592.1 alcohol dehydrogenase catalytic domain-containing protein [Microbacterium sp.]MCV0376850.1 alcohol dehydrogenase catalytic domain-containing protein [Microbacterium sp.]MCV0390610.1 alcohol dehydrogenase catalytic domain-containing protein [Microbacterium sp.]MCV0418345.1 alcohol dehydrogenase catalytic domain-containing protein [Microbacterium sp.]MCV0421987.1 alcohol dehydrogenase catalytic domain-c
MNNLAVVAHAAEDLRIEDIGAPAPRSDEAVVGIAYGGICGSDLHYWQHGAAGASVLREPMILGHEVSGVVAVAAADGTGPAVGTPVAVHPLTAHGDGRTPWPPEHPNLAPASTYLGSAMHLPHTQGAFARRVALPARMLYPLPSGLDLQTAALAEPAAVAWHGVQRAGGVRDRRVVVIGAGPIGQLVAAVAQRAGASSVTVTDLHQRPREIAEARGIRAIDARAETEISELYADVVIESSGTVPGLDAAVSAAVRGGTVVMLGLQRGGAVSAPMATAITRELTLRGSFRFGAEFGEVIAALADGSLDVRGIISQVVPVDDALDAFALAADPASSCKVLVDFGREA